MRDTVFVTFDGRRIEIPILTQEAKDATTDLRALLHF